MEIMPNSTIKFLHGIPFNNDYNDTIWFKNRAIQQSYFEKYVKYTVENQMYTRHSKNVINVELPNLQQPFFPPDTPAKDRWYYNTTESLMDCNYMMFINNSFRAKDSAQFVENRWFYAFITDVEYVNNQVARVTFEIDVMQSWLQDTDYFLEQCFVEREHSIHDRIGENIVPESLDLGYDTVCVLERIIHLNCNSVLLIADKNPDGTLPDLSLTSGRVPHTLVVKRYDFSDPDETQEFFDDINAYLRSTATNVSPEDILYMCLCPKFINNDDSFLDNLIWGYGENPEKGLKVPLPLQLGSSGLLETDGYTPKNMKMFTYPYCFITITNRQGNSQIYKFEHFQNYATQSDLFPHNFCASFAIGGESLYIPSVCLYPLGYDIVESNPPTYPTKSTIGFEYGIGISEFPQLATVGDTFKAWWAQNRNSFAANGMTQLASGFVETAVGVVKAVGQDVNGYTQAGRGIVTSWGAIAQGVAKKQDTQNMPGIVNGLTNTSYILQSADAVGYDIMVKTVNGKQAKIIDDYFSMFGYACKEVKRPNTHVRESWTFTKTIGCEIKGYLPSKYQEKICTIYDKGIRFWDSEAEIGNYSQSNRCLLEIQQGG